MKRYLAACCTACFLGVFLILAGNPALAQEMPEEPALEAAVIVNVNEADAQTIADALVGVGLTKAKAIVDYREQYGRFYSAEELTAVKGIGRSTVARNQGRISVD